MLRQVVVVGASLAGLRAVETLRERGYDGGLTLIGDETQPPYDRPPLSKQVLQGAWDPQQTLFRKKEGYGPLALEMRLGVRAQALDVAARQILLADGSSVSYDGAIVATGARVRTLPGMAPRAGLHVLRGLDDAIALSRDLAEARRVVIVGCGFIGMEVAASCRIRGIAVTAVEALPFALSPSLGQTICETVESMHRDHGVDLRTNTRVADILGDSRVTGVHLADGSRLEADLVVVGIGVTPNTEWLESSGLTLDNGIVCGDAADAAPHVYAAGDVARVPNAWLGESSRIEHWTNAVEQGVFAAESLLAGHAAARRFSSVPYFWSDQYDRKIQFAGRTRAGDEAVVIEGSTAERRFVALYRRDDRLVACLAMNHPRAFIRFRKLLAEKPGWDAALSTER